MEYVSDFLLYLVGFLLLMAVFKGAEEGFGKEGVLSSLLGYITWKICATVLSDVPRIVTDEAQTGTLEQLAVTGRPLAAVFTRRSIASFVNDGVRGLVLGAVLAFLGGVFRWPSLSAMLVFLITVVGALGCGFAFAGWAMVNKQIDGLLSLFWAM